MLLGACDRFDACDGLCATAHGVYGRCLEADGLSWTDSTEFSSESDFDNWCHTWAAERRLLARTASEGDEGLDQLLSDCQARETRLQLDDCDAFFTILLD